MTEAAYAFPPGLILIVGAALLPLFGQRGRSLLVLLLPLVTLAAAWTMPVGTVVSVAFLNYTLNPVHVTLAGRLFATIFSIMAFAGGLFALKQAKTAELVWAFAYAGSAVGVTYAGDLLTLFAFWELMAVFSTLLIWSAGSPRAYQAGLRYVLVHLFGGVILMIGIAGHIATTGSVAFEAMHTDSIAHWLILAGFVINAGAPPLSAWIPDAYPEASPWGMVFLSAFTTKTAVFVLLVGFPGADVLIPIGLYMVFYGILYALLENDMRRILAYSIINQVGFMITAIGIGTPLSLNGAAAHAFAHIIYKALLLMSAGSVLYQTGRRKCTDLGGLFRTMPKTTITGIIGAMAISAFPLTSGFTAKSLISQAAGDQHLMLVWLLLTAASAGVFLHAGIKFPWFVFFQKDSGLRPADPPLNMRWAMYLFSFLCIALGLYPQPLYAILPYPIAYTAYTTQHVLTQLQLLLFSGLAFFAFLPLLRRTDTVSLDFDWFYRKMAPAMARQAEWLLQQIRGSVTAGLQRPWRRAHTLIVRHHGPEGVLARTWPIGSMVVWVALLLVVYLLLSYV